MASNERELGFVKGGGSVYRPSVYLADFAFDCTAAFRDNSNLTYSRRCNSCIIGSLGNSLRTSFIERNNRREIMK